ncbi:MAG: tRNA uridine-5-carboxymethylaminomethyl(34) synthesis GTPase MnmE [Treponema sp.]|jgi:tRNA modification GTPase|nr:tRNA uridine-5-carboxymethylaminomethyl(34) synthesis GTPase MnmE [Treponema sp.]
MQLASYGDDTPIAAIATPLAESALALIRISGKCAIDLVAAVFSRPRNLREAPGNTIVHGWMLNPVCKGAVQGGIEAAHPSGEKIDEVLISVYRAPRSYTGEDGADISCHGGIAAVRAVMKALLQGGFREALPGEFTFRAFMNGKLDLTRAESVMELVSAKTDQGREHAVDRLSGTLEEEIRDIKSLLVQVLAGTELYLDYSEDEFMGTAAEAGPSDGGETNAEAAGYLPDRVVAEEVLNRLRALAASYRMERLYHDGALVVIAGRPNAGKSSLFNLLLKEDRSIVTDIPGTTRDWIEAWIAIEGIPIRLVDTAGLHTLEDPSGNPVEKIGMERSRELLVAADLILYVINGIEGITREDRDFFHDYAPDTKGISAPIITLWNKIDMVLPPTEQTESVALYPGEPLWGISAKTGEGIPELAAAIAPSLSHPPETMIGGGPEAFWRELVPRSSGIGSGRQKALIDLAVESLEAALALADKLMPLDIIAPLLREGVNALGEITGEVSTAEILEVMFSRFCVGK